MAMRPKVLGLTLEPNLTYRTHVHTSLQLMKTLTTTWWGKQKETLMATYKAVMRLTLASSTSTNKMQVMQDATLRTDT